MAHFPATDTDDGVMSAADKAALDALVAANLAQQYNATATATTTTTSTSFVLASGMTLTPTGGTYLAIFSASVSNSSGSTQTEDGTIYVGGSEITAARRTCRLPAAHTDVFCCAAIITPNGAQAVEGRWKTTGSTASMYQRTLILVKVKA